MGFRPVGRIPCHELRLAQVFIGSGKICGPTVELLERRFVQRETLVSTSNNGDAQGIAAQGGL